MAKVKFTKNELKAQRDAFALYRRFLPTLQLKKKQLLSEMKQVEAKIDEKKSEERRVRAEMDAWVKLFSEPVPPEHFPRIKEIRKGESNVAGVNIPVLKEVIFSVDRRDLFATPAWIDDAAKALEALARMRIEQGILAEQARLISEELTATTQRVNLFEKVKIPECRKNIRLIQIFLGDQQTAGVARAKIAKGRVVEEVAVA
ncbi:MAG: V-type ATP synthase subunit D [Candidatus Lindowbacteria bacterium RIFCSPLOWO2_12_FULL_62_27]|nr:MAG: V-type ATP synthase subunit D [Candidatus Lindowbacteria bacterium RIFCSPLOWO2_12_FULL_62_27]OGH57471.1 MAG: V-type ATP synthase subunit D [Candidatus Lindowbacteria bacterium RIFCSPLOWO2_02_FULL_62_12]